MSHRAVPVVVSHDHATIGGPPSARSAIDVSAVGQAPWDRRSRAIAGGIVGGLAAFMYGEHLLAGALGRRLAREMRGGPLLWRMAAHGAALTGLLAGSNALWKRAMRGLDPGALSPRRVEPGPHR